MKSILVVDDEPEVRRLVTRMLTKNGYLVHAADNGENAIKLFQANPDTELLLSDVIAPGMSGPMIAEEIASLKPEIKVLFMTGYEGTQVIQRYVIDKGYALIVKPFTMNELAIRVHAILGGDETQNRRDPDR